ncbi:MAG: hypothetical protein SOX46_14200 [Clostridiaceae bacterium]|uniref:XRE family transcriptional regulator n=1 Tax=Clostridium porci TaxID=2605778 RepID=A0A7X2NKK8_9CLOT|nr:XRE family transcriptional regulator [Clostridium porci]MCI6369288.1 hypothetical protein [Limosilactobacillus reuteri]MCI7182335.1 hypothetical protein [Lachnospiraceae bacterium]MDY3232699.1 hypothetical protein [Clostridiaceae bacterium]MDY5247639.1 hypothetical protein [Ligilactobacillus salivarius]MSS36647.1 XRE family transcriptional regulator [Clostridium porci]
MNEVEATLKDIIIERYGSLKKFCVIINMPWTTLDSILKRGVSNSNISNVLKITKALGISAEKLADGEIVTNTEFISDGGSAHTMAAHFDGDEFTEDELDDIRAYAEFVKNRRNRS